MFVGEIGIQRREFLYEIKFWEARRILRGYNRRERGMWSATRWQTYYLMSVSMADLKKAGINGPTDLIKFPWEKETADTTDLPSDEEIAEMQAEMDAINQYYAEKNKQP